MSDTLSTSEALELARHVVHGNWAPVTRLILDPLLRHGDPAVRAYIRQHRARRLRERMEEHRPDQGTPAHQVHIFGVWDAFGVAHAPRAVTIVCGGSPHRYIQDLPEDSRWFCAPRGPDPSQWPRFGCVISEDPGALMLVWRSDATMHTETIDATDWREPTCTRFLAWLRAIEEHPDAPKEQSWVPPTRNLRIWLRAVKEG